MRRFDDLIPHCSVFGAIQTDKAQIATLLDFSDKNPKSAKCTELQPKNAF
jgi:hypothetical protein